MRALRQILPKAVCIVILLLVLPACSYRAGMHMDPTNLAPPTNPQIQPVYRYITLDLLQEEKKARVQKIEQAATPLISEVTPYRIGFGDILSIVVWDHPELTSPVISSATAAAFASEMNASAMQGYVVSHEGMIQFPYVGQINVASLTEKEARNKLSASLARYIKNPEVTLRIQSYRSQRIYVEGEVKLPGIQAINDIPMSLPEAVNRAGGILNSGDQSQINIQRDGITYQVNLPQLVQNGINPSRIFLKNGDSVRVVSNVESKIFVLGDVLKPSTLLMRNGSLTLNEALGEAGGLNPLTAEGRQVYVVRNAVDMNPIVYNLDARTPIAFALAENFLLQPKDVIFIDATPLANWSRVASLVIPSAVSVISAVQAAK